ncbi:MAG: flagellar biosynthetic protein FliO [Peptococcaceae bacterium]|nr:flagellar biosynthetic protein FliO [Peptococcaceae bacterium]
MDGEFWGALLRLCIALPITLGLAYAVLRFGLARRYGITGGLSRRMQLVEQIPLGPKAGLSLVRVGKKYYLLAHNEETVTVVREYDSLPETIPQTLPQPQLGNLKDLVGYWKRRGRRGEHHGHEI